MSGALERRPAFCPYAEADLCGVDVNVFREDSAVKGGTAFNYHDAAKSIAPASVGAGVLPRTFQYGSSDIIFLRG